MNILQSGILVSPGGYVINEDIVPPSPIASFPLRLLLLINFQLVFLHIPINDVLILLGQTGGNEY